MRRRRSNRSDDRSDDRESNEWTPVPDPTRLTTALVDRALAAFREVVDTRLAAMDTATKLVAADVARISAVTAEATAHLREDIDRAMAAQQELLLERMKRIEDVADGKFAGVVTQFSERDTRLEQTDKERRISLDAALAAAKEAVAAQQEANATAIGKSEDGTKERLDALERLMTNSNAAMNEKVDDLKERLARSEASNATAGAGKADGRADRGQWILLAGVLIAAASLIIAFAH